MLAERHANRRQDDHLEREYVVYRHPDDHLRSRLVTATRRRLSTLLLAMGTRLSDEPPGIEADTAIRTIN
jgi:hypothetical protein